MIGALLLGGAAVTVYTVIRQHEEFISKARPWRAAIEKTATRYALDKHVLAALLWQESRFNPDARGKAGEVGMSQVLPIAHRDALANGYHGTATVTELFAGDKAIDFAGFFLRLNLTRTGGSMIEALRAYNAGIGRIQTDKVISQSYSGGILSNAAIDYLYQQLQLGKVTA